MLLGYEFSRAKGILMNNDNKVKANKNKTKQKNNGSFRMIFNDKQSFP